MRNKRTIVNFGTVAELREAENVLTNEFNRICKEENIVSEKVSLVWNKGLQSVAGKVIYTKYSNERQIELTLRYFKELGIESYKDS